MTERETQLIKDISRIHNNLSTDGSYTLKWKENIKSRSVWFFQQEQKFSQKKAFSYVPKTA